MPQGYAGLSKKRSLGEGTSELSPSFRSPTKQYGSLRVVEGGGFPLSLVEIQCLARAVSAAGTPRYFRFKRVIDIVGATLAVAVLSPLILGIVLCAFCSGSTPFFKHRRVGRHGEFFECYKFRTMGMNADQVLQNLLDSNKQIKEEWLRDHKLRNDPRITRLGRFLRRTSLDELPQLWNVLRGDMSLVGPRPVVPDELARYGKKVGTFLSVKPGITGLWQVSGRNDVDYRRRVALDVCYARAGCAKLDFYILLRTFPAVFAKDGAY